MSIFQHVKDITGRRTRSLCPVLAVQESGMLLGDGGKNYPGEKFFRNNGPRESAIFPAIPGIQKMRDW